MNWSPNQQAKEKRLRKKPDGKHNLNGRGTNGRGSYGGGAQGKGPSKQLNSMARSAEKSDISLKG
jgi:hypothetical protein